MGLLVSELINMGEKRLAEAGIDNAKGEAQQIFCGMKNYDRAKFFLKWSKAATDNEIESYMQLIDKRTERIPLQHILGSTEFMGYTFKVAENVLIPRMDTEVLVSEALKVIGKKDTVLDLCTGSGVIGISIAKESEKYNLGVKVTCSDVSDDAIALTRENAALTNGKVEIVKSSLFEKFKRKKFDMIVSNPPYIRRDVIPTLEVEVKDHDPMLALDGGEDGLDFYRVITEEAPDHLKKKGRLIYEIGHDQGQPVKEMMECAGFTDVEIIKDLAGLDRVVSGVKGK